LSKRSLLKQVHIISQRLSHKHLIHLKTLSNTVPELKTKYSTATSQPVKCCADTVGGCKHPPLNEERAENGC